MFIDELLIIKVVKMKPEYKNQTYSKSYFNLTEFLSSNMTYSNESIYAANYTNKTMNDPRNFSLFYEQPPLMVMEYVQMPQLLTMPRETRY